ncbi:MAG: YraN family protein [Nitrospinota bacterium]|nr:YraN family protein [Nitrospinota bacterium]
MKGDILTFIEIKTRSSREYIPSEFAVTKNKQSKTKRSAAHYLGKHGIENRDCRFDIVAITREKGHSSL